MSPYALPRAVTDDGHPSASLYLWRNTIRSRRSSQRAAFPVLHAASATSPSTLRLLLRAGRHGVPNILSRPILYQQPTSQHATNHHPCNAAHMARVCAVCGSSPCLLLILKTASISPVPRSAAVNSGQRTGQTGRRDLYLQAFPV